MGAQKRRSSNAQSEAAITPKTDQTNTQSKKKKTKSNAEPKKVDQQDDELPKLSLIEATSQDTEPTLKPKPRQRKTSKPSKPNSSLEQTPSKANDKKTTESPKVTKEDQDSLKKVSKKEAAKPKNKEKPNSSIKNQPESSRPEKSPSTIEPSTEKVATEVTFRPTYKSPIIKPEQLTLAVKTLIDYSNKTLKRNLDDGQMFADDIGANDRFLSLVISLKRIPGKDKHKPIKLALDHPLLDPKSTPVCLIVKDPQSEYKALLEERKITFISKVVGIQKLKGKHGSFEARRQLLNSHGLFLADARVIPMLPGLLGKQFFQAKKLPVPVDITQPNKVKAELEQGISSTYLRLSTGTCISIKIADLSRHNETEVKENLQKVIDQVGKRIPLGGWTNVQGLHIKTGTSASLPVWLADLTPDQYGRFGLDPSQDEVEAKKGAQEKKRQAIDEKSQRKKRRLSTISAGSADSE